MQHLSETYLLDIDFSVFFTRKNTHTHARARVIRKKSAYIQASESDGRKASSYRGTSGKRFQNFTNEYGSNRLMYFASSN